MTARLPWILCAIAVPLVIGGSVTNSVLDDAGTADLVSALGFTLLGIGAATTGAIVSTRVPGNAVGWILLALGTGLGFVVAAGAYAELSATTSLGPLPADRWLAWLGDWPGIAIIFGLTAFLLLLFPDGHLLSPRWRYAAWFIAFGVGLATVAQAFNPDDPPKGFTNPVAPTGTGVGLVRDLGTITDILALPVLVLAASALVVRLRRSRGTERLQLKWFTYAAALAGSGSD
jgi:hypothetical protein